MTIKEMATKIMANIPAVTTTVIRMTVAKKLAVTTMVIITMVVTKIMVVAINIHMMELTTKNMVMMMIPLIKQVVTVKMVFITIMETVGPSKNRIVEAVLAMIIWYNAWAAQYMLANTTVKHMWMEKPGPLKTVVTPVHVN
jgi:hypothetical protein